MKKIIVDIYGGDNTPSEVIKGALLALEEENDFAIVLVGETDFINNELKNYQYDCNRITVIEGKPTVKNTDSPSEVFRNREDSSLIQGMYQLKGDDTYGLLTCANTGCVLVGSIFKVGLSSPKLKFPILASILPVINDRFVCLCDCGANMNSKPQDLVNFALAGEALYRVYTGQANPRIGLLSVGSEDTKGNDLTKAAFSLLKEQPLNFIGNIEGSNVFNGNVDVVVCDGFDGNVVLKNAESVGKIAMKLALEAKTSSKEVNDVLDELCGRLFYHFDFNSRGASTLLGINKIILKAHGIANHLTIKNSIIQLNKLAKADLVKNVSESLK